MQADKDIIDDKELFDKSLTQKKLTNQLYYLLVKRLWVDSLNLLTKLIIWQGLLFGHRVSR
jgi:hypothetical protein